MTIYEEPQTLQEAINHPTHGKQWEEAIQYEYKSLIDNQTWKFVPLPKGRLIVGCKWIFRYKLGADGTIQRFRARLVAKGFTQTYGVDYNETFAPVAKLPSLRLLLAIAVIEDLEIYQMDVSSAFLLVDLEEEIYMDQPEGYEKGNLVCRLQKSLYGLKQSPRVWNQKIHQFFINNGFTQTNTDYSIYINKVTEAMIGIWVDDLILIGKNIDIINDLKSRLNKAFEMKDLKDLTYFLGIQVRRNRQIRTIHLDQTQYILKILKRFKLQDSKPIRTPLETGIKLTKSEDQESFDPLKYQSAVGSLMYAMVGTRPDITFAVAAVSQFNSNPNIIHWKVVKRIFRYLKGTADFGITYGNTKIKLEGYSNADWGGNLDNRRSTTGYLFTYRSRATSWKGKQQTTVALSTTEAEYMAAIQATKEAIWLQGLLTELGRNKDKPVPI